MMYKHPAERCSRLPDSHYHPPCITPQRKPKKHSNPNLTGTHLPITLTPKPPIVPPESSVKTDPSTGFEQGRGVPEDGRGGSGEGGAVEEVV
jgi:hypothetical protein